MRSVLMVDGFLGFGPIPESMPLIRHLDSWHTLKSPGILVVDGIPSIILIEGWYVHMIIVVRIHGDSS